MAGITVSGGSTLSTSITDSIALDTINQGINSLLSQPGVTGVSITGINGAIGAVRKPLAGVQGMINLKQGEIETGSTFTLGSTYQGVSISGTEAVTIEGRAVVGNSGFVPYELLIGNSGNDTIKGAGGSGTIVSGSGNNTIHTGGGDVVVDSSGDDTIFGGKGIDNIEATGSATVHAGTGFTIFTDKGAADSTFKVKGDTAPGGGLLEGYSGLGKDTFVSGSGSNYFTDSHTGGADSPAVVFKFHFTVEGTTVISDFDVAKDTVLLSTNFGITSAQAAAAITVVAGSSYLDLHGTKIEFAGTTNVTASDFSFYTPVLPGT
jgi:Ca2+-binding RTX toxin-like protein